MGGCPYLILLGTGRLSLFDFAPASKEFFKAEIAVIENGQIYKAFSARSGAFDLSV